MRITQEQWEAVNLFFSILIMLPITDKSRRDEWQTVLAIAKNNGYPTSMIHNLKTRLITRKQNQNRQQRKETVSRRKCVTHTHFSPLIRRVTNLFKQPI